MEKPKRFIRVETHEERDHWGYVTSKSKSFHFGRVEVSGLGLAAMVVAPLLCLFVLQIVLGVVSGGSVMWPLISMLGIVGTFLAILILRSVFDFFRWLAGEITIHGPGKG